MRVLKSRGIAVRLGAYHLYAIPRFVNRWAVSLAYLTDVFFDRSVVSIGLSKQEDAQFSASEGMPMPKAD